ncbi:MAG: DUF418 domain-containing protein [Myxococcales bacterium]|nr:DUF418 domain-containing protein [Myxococcales bacterium]USN51037.1 MAG: DUF418 domain-containing protein [Myxococcales bacterium]
MLGQQHQESSQTRILSLDVVRGIAIIGVLLVNGPALNGPAYKDSHTFAFQNTLADVWYSKLLYCFANDNFYPIFACLFGLSTAIFMKNKPAFLAQNLLKRRLLSLLLLGILHATLVWWGDILVAYALLGFSLVWLYSKNAHEILLYLLTIASLTIFLSISFYYLNDHPPFPATAKALLTYSQGDFIAVSKQRINDFLGSYIPGYLYGINLFQIVDFLMFYSQLLLCFYFGYWVFVSGWLKKLSTDYVVAKRTALISFALTFVVAIISDSLPLVGEALFAIKGFLRGIFYSSSIIFLCHHSWWLRLCRPFSVIGRMSLTNYLLHNIVLSLVFYSYGLGLYGSFGPFYELPILLSLIIFSMILSSLWLKHFKMGPFEWLWRAAIYGCFPQLKRQQIAKLSVERLL